MSDNFYDELYGSDEMPKLQFRDISEPVTMVLELPKASDHILIMRDPNGNLIVDVRRDGTVEYGETYNPDEASKTFWEYLIKAFPGHIGQ